jgi:hypothetical protein
MKLDNLLFVMAGVLSLAFFLAFCHSNTPTKNRAAAPTLKLCPSRGGADMDNALVPIAFLDASIAIAVAPSRKS